MSQHQNSSPAVKIRNDLRQSDEILEAGYVCSECQRSFRRKDKLTRHFQCVHENLRPFMCPFCELTFNRRDKMRRHVSSIHLKEKPFQCNHCDFATNRKERIRTHVMTVHATFPDDFTVIEKSET